MRFTGIMLFCEDIRGLTRFYEQVLQLRRDPQQTLPDHRFVSLIGAGRNAATLNLHSGTKPNGGRAKLMFRCESIALVYERLVAHGKHPRKPTVVPDSIMTFDFDDPEGNRIQLYGPWKGKS